MSLLSSQIGPYRLLGQLGSGGMGAVYEAVHDEMERRVAIKVLKPEFATDPEIAARFFNEARAVNRVAHPGVVQVSDWGQTPDGLLYLVMELLVGETLSKFLKRHSDFTPIPAERTISISWEIAETLTCAHDKGVIHRDIKPDNIILIFDPIATAGHRVKILDFGIAKLQRASVQMTARPQLMGTAPYMSPEQCRSLSDIDGRTDVYSLGILMYRMLAGRLPFPCESFEATIAQHLFVEPAPLVPLDRYSPPALTSLVHELLRKDRELRPRMREVAERLSQLRLTSGAPTGALSNVLMSSSPPVASSSAVNLGDPVAIPASLSTMLGMRRLVVAGVVVGAGAIGLLGHYMATRQRAWPATSSEKPSSPPPAPADISTALVHKPPTAIITAEPPRVAPYVTPPAAPNIKPPAVPSGVHADATESGTTKPPVVVPQPAPPRPENSVPATAHVGRQVLPANRAPNLKKRRTAKINPYDI